MKLKASKKTIKDGYYKILSIGYCDAQYLLSEENPFAYSSGSYGWACDYYDIDGVCISTGYSPISKNTDKIDYKLLREYDEIASKTERKDRSALLREFLKKVGV